MIKKIKKSELDPFYISETYKGYEITIEYNEDGSAILVLKDYDLG